MKKQKPTGTLKKFLDVRDKNSRVVGSVERFLLSRPASGDRVYTVIHPSDMAKPDWCHRAQYYMLQGAPPPPSKFKVSLKQLLVFSEGHRIHGRWQDWIGQMGNLYGLWECDICYAISWGMGGDTCTACGEGTHASYKEVPLKYEPLRISGHADGWVKGLGDDLLLEIKSVGEGSFRWENPDLFYKHNGDIKKMWSEFDSPFYSHIMQTQIYMKLIELIGFSNPPEEVVFIYENKATQEVKEFVIPKSDFGIVELFKSVEMINAAVDNSTPPACNIDPVAGCAKCNHYLEVENAKLED